MLKDAVGGGVGRRAALGGAAAAALVPALAARAAIVDLVAVGQDGWLFPIWDEVRHADLNAMNPVAQVLGAAAQAMAQAKIQVVFALTPVKSRIYRDELPSDFRWNPDAEKRFAAATDKLRAAAPGALMVDLLAPLTALHSQPGSDALWFKGDTHWTGTASQAAATEVARAIKARLQLPAATQPGTQLGAPTQQSWERDDLASLLPPAMGSKYGTEYYKVRQPAQAAASDLVADDTADVALVGNSFMQPRLGFVPMLSNQLGRPVSLTWRVHQLGPYATMLEYLTSSGFRAHRPAAIVWNFHETDMLLPPDRRDGWGQNVMTAQAFLTQVKQALGVA